MSVWKRLANVAKGTVKNSVKDWQREEDPAHAAALERELTELERHPAPGEDVQRRPAPAARPSSASRPARNPAEEPVARTDLFGDPEPQSDDSEADDAGEETQDGVRTGRGGRRL